MGGPYEIQEPPRDLKVTLQDTSLVFPSEQTERKSLFLSNIDQVLNFDVQTVHFFRAHADYPPDKVSERIKNALSRVLVAYDFLAGRLRPSNGGGRERLEIDCDGSGAGFVVASSEYSLAEIGDLVYPNPAFGQLIVQGSSLDKLGTDGDLPLCIVQVTSFKCGGFAMGISTNHATFDGICFKTFLENLASQASDKPYLAITPCNDRHLLAARSPPRVTFPHHELLKLQFLTPDHDHDHDHDHTPPPVFDLDTDHDLDFKIFRLTPADVSLLKKRAKSDTPTKAKITGFNVVTTHVWRCKALSSRETSRNPDRSSTVLYAVDIRPRLDPPLPKSYTGNAVLTAYATATCKELEELPLSALVEMVSEGAGRMTDEYARSAIDWGELYKGFPNGEFLVSSWWRLGFAQVKFPWGKPRYSCPVVYHRKDIILLFPDIEDDDDNDNNSNGVNVLVALPREEMLAFEKLFHKFLACT